MTRPITNLHKHYKLIRSIVETLFEPERRRLLKHLTDINSENKRLQQRPYDGFLFRGKFHIPMNGSVTYPARGEQKTPLHWSLVKAMEIWIQDTKYIEADTAAVNQALSLLLTPCKSQQQIRNALPECLVLLINELSGYPRTEESAFTLVDNERALRQYEKILPKIEVYSVTRLIF